MYLSCTVEHTHVLPVCSVVLFRKNVFVWVWWTLSSFQHWGLSTVLVPHSFLVFWERTEVVISHLSATAINRDSMNACSHQTTPLHTLQYTPRTGGLAKHTSLTGYEPKQTWKFDDSLSPLWPCYTDSTGWKSFTTFDEQPSLRNSFHVTNTISRCWWEHKIHHPCSSSWPMHCMDLDGTKTLSWEWNLTNKAYRPEILKKWLAMKREACSALYFSKASNFNSQSEHFHREHEMPWIRAVRESCERFEENSCSRSYTKPQTSHVGRTAPGRANWRQRQGVGEKSGDFRTPNAEKTVPEELYLNEIISKSEHFNKFEAELGVQLQNWRMPDCAHDRQLWRVASHASVDESER